MLGRGVGNWTPHVPGFILLVPANLKTFVVNCEMYIWVTHDPASFTSSVLNSSVISPPQAKPLQCLEPRRDGVELGRSQQMPSRYDYSTCE